jgi:hypothetical protein
MIAVIEVVGQSDSIALGNRQNLVLTITIERSPLNRRDIFTPIEEDFTTVVADGEFTPPVGGRETNHQRSELIFSSRGIDVRLKLVMRPLVNLNVRMKIGQCTLSL